MKHILGLVIELLILLLWATCADAQTYQARYDRARAAQRYAEAADVLREAINDPATPATAVQSYRAGRAVALLLAGDLVEAEAEATRCATPEGTAAAGQCQTVLTRVRAAAPPAPPAPVQRVEAPAAVLPAAPPAPPPALRVVVTSVARSWTPGVGPIALWSVGAASLAFAASLAVMRSDALGSCTVRGDSAICPDQGSLDRARGAVDLSTGANVALGVGIAALAAGTGWWLLDGRAVAPVVTTQGFTVAIAGRW